MKLTNKMNLWMIISAISIIGWIISIVLMFGVEPDILIWIFASLYVISVTMMVVISKKIVKENKPN